MNYSTNKIELIQKILNSENKNLINHIKAVFLTQEDEWWESIPNPIKESINRGIKQSEEGKITSHQEVMKKYKKWLKK